MSELFSQPVAVWSNVPWLGHVFDLLKAAESKGIYARRASTLSHSQVTIALDELKSYINEPDKLDEKGLHANDLFAAIEDASEPLASAILERYRTGKGDPADLTKSVARYARRAAYRATPFGRFAGVGEVASSPPRAGSKASNSGLSALICTEGYGSRPPFASGDARVQWLVSNRAVTVTDDHAALRELCLANEPGVPRQQRFIMPPLLRAIWDECRLGMWVEDVIQGLHLEFGISEDDIGRIVDVMVSKQLLFALPKPQTMPELVGRPARVIDRSDSAIVRLTTMPVDGLPQGVGRKIDGIVARLFQLTQYSKIADAKEQFSNRFLDRFGAGVRVPYLLAVDDIRGVGLIDLQEASPETTQHGGVAGEMLEELVLRAYASGSTEIALSDHDVDLLVDPNRQALGVDTDVVYNIDAQSGRIELAPMPTSAFSGQAVVRHWAVFPFSWFKSVTMKTDIAGRQVEPIEVWSFPRTRKILDIMHAPQVTDRYLSLGFADASGKCLTIDDVELIHDGTQIWVLARDSQYPLVVRNLSVVNIPAHLSRDAQTIITLGRETERDWVPFNWGPESTRSFLPAVTYRGVRISKALWRMPAKLFRRELSINEWRSEFEFWRDATALPQWIEFGAGDNILPFDTRDPLEYDEIRRTIRSDSPVAFAAGHAKDNNRAVEHVQHVYRPAPRRNLENPDFLSAPAYSQPSVRRDWLGFELVGAAKVAWLPETTLRLVDVALKCGIRNWHFVVYNDPDPHTRLRFHVRSATDPSVEILREAAIQEIGSSVRVVREVPFIPEYQRYGGESCFGSIASVFTASSQAALELQGRSVDAATRLETACLTAIDLMAMLLGSDDWENIVGPALSYLKSPTDQKKERREALSKMPIRVMAGSDPILAELGGANHASGITMSVLHMHANRMFAGDRGGEAQMFAVLRSYVLRQRYFAK